MPDVATGDQMRCLGSARDVCYANLVVGVYSPIWLSCRQTMRRVSTCISQKDRCTDGRHGRGGWPFLRINTSHLLADRYIQAVIRMCDGSVLAATECELLHKDSEQYRFTFNARLRCEQRGM
jgi:hypothetical protein